MTPNILVYIDDPTLGDATRFCQALMRALYQNPMVSIKSVAQLIEAQTNTAAALIDDFVKLGILQEFTGQKRNRLFVFEKYVRLFKR